jgi:hypothetical protein
MKKSTAVYTLILTLFALPAFGGWVETDDQGNQSFYSANKWKEASTENPIWSSIDLATGQLLLVHADQKIYAQGSLDEYCLATALFFEKMMTEMPPDHRALAEQIINKGRSKGNPHVSVAKVGPGGTIAGYATDHYQVMVNGGIYEDLWLAAGAPVLKELDTAAFRRLQTKMAGCIEAMSPSMDGAWEQQPEQTAAYEELTRKGWVMRSIYNDNGVPMGETLVLSLEKKDLADSEFQPPKGFRKVPFEQVMFSEY